jgi:nucleotide-binding universal stress UspA family protein
MSASTPPSNRRVVVGFDGSRESTAALEWAADDAARRGCGLHVVYAFLWPLTGMYLGPSPGGPAEGGLANAARALLDDAARQAREAHPDLDVTTELVVAAPAPVLVEKSRTALLVVVGCRGLGAFAGRLLGSVSAQVAEHARCPVVVIRGEARTGPDRRQVVVGSDGSAYARAAVGFAFEEANLRQWRLMVVHAWTPPAAPGGAAQQLDPGDAESIEAVGARLLAETLAEWEHTYPDVLVERRVLHTNPAKALVAESATAGLLVLGSRGRGGFAGLLLGSTSRVVLHHAACPVAVVHAEGEPGER